MNMIVSALRFLFTQTLDRLDLARKLVRTRHERKIPAVLRNRECRLATLDAVSSIALPMLRPGVCIRLRRF